MIYEAQPTPGLTLMAAAGQFVAQAPHSMHASRSANRALLFTTVKTVWGQTIAHIPQPMHFSASSSKVVTFSKYLNFFIYSSIEIKFTHRARPYNRSFQFTNGAATQKIIAAATDMT